MISEARTYLKSRIATVASSYRQIDDPIGDDDLSRLDIENGFRIIFGNNAISYDGNTYEDEVAVAIELFKKAGLTQVVESFDSLYDTALNVRDAVTNPTTVKENANFNDILAQGFTIESIQTNDKTFKVTLNFNLKRSFTY